MTNANRRTDTFVLADAQTATPISASDEHARETHLLLSSLDLALWTIERARGCADHERAAQLLMQAVESYGTVKGLLPKLGLPPEQLAVVSERLKAVQQRLREESTASESTTAVASTEA